MHNVSWARWSERGWSVPDNGDGAPDKFPTVRGNRFQDLHTREKQRRIVSPGTDPGLPFAVERHPYPASPATWTPSWRSFKKGSVCTLNYNTTSGGVQGYPPFFYSHPALPPKSRTWLQEIHLACCLGGPDHRHVVPIRIHRSAHDVACRIDPGRGGRNVAAGQ